MVTTGEWSSTWPGITPAESEQYGPMMQPLAELDVLLAVERGDGEADRRAVAEAAERTRPPAPRPDGAEPFDVRPRRRGSHRRLRPRPIRSSVRADGRHPSSGPPVGRVASHARRRNTTAANRPPSEHDHHAEHEHGRPARVVRVRTHAHELGHLRPRSSQQHRGHCTMRAERGTDGRSGRDASSYRWLSRATSGRCAPRRRSGVGGARRVRQSPRPTLSSPTRCCSPGPSN